MTTLESRRVIAASPARVFRAWTDPDRLMRWWGPAPVRCDHAEVDLRVGGRYRIANRFPDGKVLWICGAFEQVERPRLLVYSWRIEPGTDLIERVTVRFEAKGQETEVIVLHERIPDAATRERHEAGWAGCLEKLARELAAPRRG